MDANPASADLYERLGISPDAKTEEIKAAFRAMRKELHPDSRPPSLRGHFDQLMKNVNEAHQTLTDTRARAKYDARRTYRAQTQEAEQNAAQEEDRRRQQEAERQRHQREAEARERERQDEDRRRAEDEARAGDEDEEFSWWDYAEEFAQDFTEGDAEGEDPARRQAPTEPQPAASSAGSFLHKLPGPVHRVMIYTSGSWLWLVAAVVLWNLPFWGAEFVATVSLLGVTVISLGVLVLTIKAAVVIAPVERVIGFFMPSMGRFSVLWFSRRVVESAALAPLFIILATLLSWLWGLLSLAAIGYVVLWGVEFVRWRQSRRQEVGGDRWR